MIEVPANYFGKGENYNLPDDAETIREFERRFTEWEKAHPDDPTGDIALAAYKKPLPTALVTTKSTSDSAPTPVSDDVEEEDGEEFEFNDSSVRLRIPSPILLKFKKYARYKRKRPRDILIFWITRFCNLD